MKGYFHGLIHNRALSAALVSIKASEIAAMGQAEAGLELFLAS